MSENGLTKQQAQKVRLAINAQRLCRTYDEALAHAVKEARAADVPILYLADALGVSRSRIRVLARGDRA